MSSKDYSIFVKSVFEPIANSAGRPELLEKLRTADLPKEKRKIQFDQFKALKLSGQNVVYLPGGGFHAIYEHGDRQFLAISTSDLNSSDVLGLQSWAESLDLEFFELDESTFLFLAHTLKGYFKIVDRLRVESEALNEIDIINDDYSGHAFEDLFQYYKQLFIYEIAKDSRYSNAGIYEISADLCCALEKLRSPIIDDEIASAASKIIEYSTIDREKIFMAVTASQWRHVFLEFYRCIESTFFLPWTLELKAAGFEEKRAVDLKSICRKALNWREKEEPSIEKLFGLVAGDPDLEKLEQEIPSFADLKNNKDFQRSQIGKRVYKIRNGLVHHEDYLRPEPQKIEDSEWRLLAQYLCKVDKIHGEYEQDLTPKNASPR